MNEILVGNVFAANVGRFGFGSQSGISYEWKCELVGHFNATCVYECVIGTAKPHSEQTGMSSVQQM